MLNKQADIMRTSEGDAWFERNKAVNRDHDPVLAAVLDNPSIQPVTVLEVACGTGWRLQRIKERFPNADCSGCDLSWDAIAEGRKRFAKLALRNASAQSLGYADGSFDLVILGFFLYLVDREDLFQVVTEVDRVLRDKGMLIIHDFSTDTPHSRNYAHDSRLLSYKMDYPRLWLANPAYKIEKTTTLLAGSAMETVVTLRKDIQAAWPRY